MGQPHLGDSGRPKGNWRALVFASPGEAVFDGARPAEEDRERLGLRRREQVAAMLGVRRCKLLEVCGFLLVQKAWVPLPTAAHLTGVEVYFRALGL